MDFSVVIFNSSAQLVIYLPFQKIYNQDLDPSSQWGTWISTQTMEVINQDVQILLKIILKFSFHGIEVNSRSS